MLLREADILAGFRRFWDEDGPIAKLIPGGLHWGKAPETHDGSSLPTPYAIVGIVAAEPEYNSGRSYVQSFVVTIEVRSRQGPVDSAEIEWRLDGMYDRDRNTEMQIDRGQVLDMKMMAGGLAQETQQSEGSDVVLLTKRWEVLMQGQR